MKARINVSKSVLTLLLSSALRASAERGIDRKPRGILQTHPPVSRTIRLQVMQRNDVADFQMRKGG